MKDRTVRYSLFGCGVAVLAMAVAASAISILDMPPPPKKKALVIEVDKEEPKKSDAQTGKSYADASAETVANRFPEPAAQNGLPPSGIVDGQFFFSSRSSAEELKSIIDQMNAMSSSKK